jgi:ribosomal protein L14
MERIRKKMVQQRTIREVRDNSGVRDVRCIQVKNGKGKEEIGKRVRGSVQKVKGVGKSWKRGGRVKGVRVITAKERKRKNGMWLRTNKNGRVLRNAKMEPRGNRVRGVRPTELRRIGYGKIRSRSRYVV